jgi:ligand-binding SRPBCC domain-containing protein
MPENRAKRHWREPGRAGYRGEMELHRLERVMRVERPLREVFAFFADAANLEAITPAFLRFRILSPLPVEMRVGARIEYALTLFGVPLRWDTRITEWQPGVRFVDEQESGPYSVWRHTHEFAADGDGATIVKDVVEYREPLGPLGQVAHALFVTRALARIFDHRREAISRLLSPRIPGSPLTRAGTPAPPRDPPPGPPGLRSPPTAG